MLICFSWASSSILVVEGRRKAHPPECTSLQTDRRSSMPGVVCKGSHRSVLDRNWHGLLYRCWLVLLETVRDSEKMSPTCSIAAVVVSYSTRLDQPASGFRQQSYDLFRAGVYHMPHIVLRRAGDPFSLLSSITLLSLFHHLHNLRLQ